jgi:hypothetical protein
MGKPHWSGLGSSASCHLDKKVGIQIHPVTLEKKVGARMSRDFASSFHFLVDVPMRQGKHNTLAQRMKGSRHQAESDWIVSRRGSFLISNKSIISHSRCMVTLSNITYTSLIPGDPSKVAPLPPVEHALIMNFYLPNSPRTSKIRCKYEQEPWKWDYLLTEL